MFDLSLLNSAVMDAVTGGSGGTGAGVSDDFLVHALTKSTDKIIMTARILVFMKCDFLINIKLVLKNINAMQRHFRLSGNDVAVVVFYS
jgi:adenosine/AMP kinase